MNDPRINPNRRVTSDYKPKKTVSFKDEVLLIYRVEDYEIPEDYAKDNERSTTQTYVTVVKLKEEPRQRRQRRYCCHRFMGLIFPQY